jgi:hypothetical protein
MRGRPAVAPPEPPSVAHAVRVLSLQVIWPLDCPCCGSPALAGLEVAPGLRAPYCQPCALHATAWRSSREARPRFGARRFGSLAALAAALAASVALAAAAHYALALIAAGAAALLFVRFAHLSRLDAESAVPAIHAGWARAAVGPACCGPGPAVRYVGQTGDAHVFEIDRADYAAAFAAANAGNVVE